MTYPATPPSDISLLYQRPPPAALTIFSSSFGLNPLAFGSDRTPSALVAAKHRGAASERAIPGRRRGLGGKSTTRRGRALPPSPRLRRDKGASGSDDYIFRKLASSLGPSSVRKLSGWNWTPSMGMVLWRMPMISVSGASTVRAVTSNSGERVSGLITSEW